MLYKSMFGCFEPVEIPGELRIERLDNKTSIFVKNKKGTEFLLFTEEKTKIEHPARMFEQRFFDDKGQLHRNEEQGPALVGSRDFYIYVKHGKKHRVSGPAFKTATGEEKYYLENVELTRQLWTWCIEHNGKKPIKKLNVSPETLKKIASELGRNARASSSVGGCVVPASEVASLDEATLPKNWKMSGARLNPDGTTEFSLNCKPLDDTLRCYVIVNWNGTILRSYLQIE